MKTALKKPLVLTAALVAPFFMGTTAAADIGSNSGGGLVNQQAVSELSTSLKTTLKAYTALQQGDVTAARTALDKALRDMQSAVAKEPTLGIAQTSASALHSDLKSLRSKMTRADQYEVKSDMAAVLSRAGINTG